MECSQVTLMLLMVVEEAQFEQQGLAVSCFVWTVEIPESLLPPPQRKGSA